LGRGTADDLGVSVGETVTVEPPRDGDPLTLSVTGVVLPGGTQDQTQAFVLAPAGLSAVVCGGTPLEECDLSVNLFADASSEAGRAALEGVGFSDAVPPPSVARLEQAGSIPWFLAGFLCLLGAAGLLHELVTTVRRRRHDLAVVRALGLTRRRSAAAVTWQAVFTALAGGLAGLVLGGIIGPLVWRSIAEDLGVLVSTSLPLVAGALVLLAVMGVAVVLALPPRWRAERLSLARVLRAE
jgi:ABC-type lipoprotein release transport system permease subunit